MRIRAADLIRRAPGSARVSATAQGLLRRYENHLSLSLPLSLSLSLPLPLSLFLSLPLSMQRPALEKDPRNNGGDYLSASAGAGWKQCRRALHAGTKWCSPSPACHPSIYPPGCHGHLKSSALPPPLAHSPLSHAPPHPPFFLLLLHLSY